MKKIVGRSNRRWGTPQRYRLEFINENTFNRVWAFRFSRIQVIAWTIVAVAAVAALFWMIARFTPVGNWLPGAAQEHMRHQIVEFGIRVDSLQNRLRILESYSANIIAAVGGKPTDSRVSTVISDSDSLMDASEIERNFVASYNPSGRFNISVLSPIAAEGMAFYSPIVDSRLSSEPDSRVAVLAVNEQRPVMAVYRGTVVSISRDPLGYVLTIQHNNNFISQYSGLENVYVKKDSHVDNGEAIGCVTAEQPLLFEMWHDGVAVPPDRIISF